jgi:hypothetical protein
MSYIVPILIYKGGNITENYRGILYMPPVHILNNIPLICLTLYLRVILREFWGIPERLVRNW